jgi:hypothetical protein
MEACFVKLIRHLIQDEAVEAFIVLGSNRPVKAFAKLKFERKGDILWVNDLLSYEGGVDEHVSFHQSGHIASTSINRRDGYSRQRLQQPTDACVTQFTSGWVRLSEEYFYEGLAELKVPKGRRIFVECLDATIIGASMKYSIDLINGRDEALIQSSIGRRVASNNPRQHVLVFEHQRRTLLLCLEFNDGDGPVDEDKLRETDQRSLTHMKVCLEDTVEISGTVRVETHEVNKENPC